MVEVFVDSLNNFKHIYYVVKPIPIMIRRVYLRFKLGSPPDVITYFLNIGNKTSS